MLGAKVLGDLLDVLLDALGELGHDLVRRLGKFPETVLMVAVEDDVERALLEKLQPLLDVGRDGLAVPLAVRHEGLHVDEVPEVDALRSFAAAERPHELDDRGPRHRVDMVAVRTTDGGEALPTPGDVHLCR